MRDNAEVDGGHRQAGSRRMASIVIASAGLVATAGQALLAFIWTRTDVKAQFLSFFRGLYPEVPRWTEVMFGLGQLVWLVPAISAAFLYFGFRHRAWPSLAVALILSVAGLVAMVYAMYPIHLMLKVNI